ncbi:MBL fold metallo-hydrolase [Candidatus Woesearchaeota archaeon]|nr:MBL fold metallo-hydrolase [Candidatus Woesearchaeota archaeon]
MVSKNKMFFKQIKVGPMDNFNYILGDSGIAAVIDPAFEEDKLLKIAAENSLSIKIILLTHAHPDHIEGVERLAKETKADIYVHENEKHEVEGMGNVIAFSGEKAIKIGEIEISAIETPGHTPGGVSYIVGKRIFTGDALFIGAIGRTDLPGGDAETLYKTMMKFKSLPDDLEICPGHDYGEKPFAKLKEEKKNNPYLQCSSLKEFMQLIG